MSGYKLLHAVPAGCIQIWGASCLHCALYKFTYKLLLTTVQIISRARFFYGLYGSAAMGEIPHFSFH